MNTQFMFNTLQCTPKEGFNLNTKFAAKSWSFDMHGIIMHAAYFGLTVHITEGPQ